jgi:hypothetical protein
MGILRAMSVLPTGITPYYFNALDLYGAPNDGTMPEQKKLAVFNNKIYQYGYTSTIVGGIYLNRPYIVEYTTTGEISSYKVYQDELYTHVAGFCIDSSGNKYVLLGQYRYSSSTTYKFRLIKYDSSDVVLLTKEFVGTATTFGRCFGMVIDSSNNLYVGIDIFTGLSGSGITVLKFDTSLSCTWGTRCNPSLINPISDDCRINVDSSGNTILTIKDQQSSPSNSLYYVIKINSSGIVQWTRKITSVQTGNRSGATVVDSSGNIFVLMLDKIVKILADGTISYKHSLSSGTYYDMYLNSLGNLVLIGASSVVAISKDTVAPKSSILASTYYNDLLFDRIVSNDSFSFVLNSFTNGSVYTPSVIKVASNGYPPNVGARVIFSQVDDQGDFHSWDETISISLDANISITDATMTTSAVAVTSTSTRPTSSDVTQTDGTTVPTVYTAPLK